MKESSEAVSRPLKMDPWIKKLSLWMFLVGTALGLLGSWAYYRYMVSAGTWEPGGTASFHLILIGYGCAIMLPLIILSVYLLVRGYTMQLYGLELMEESSRTIKTGKKEFAPLVEKATEVIEQAKSIIEHVDQNKEAVTEVVQSLKGIEATLRDALSFKPAETPSLWPEKEGEK
jgi:hypothetical protein